MNQNTDVRVTRKRRITTNVILIIISALTAALTVSVCLRVIEKHDREMTTGLVSEALQAVVDGEFDKPVHVAQTMAGDYLLREYIQKEATTPEDEFTRIMSACLSGIKESNQWESVYFTSAATMRYYTVNGMEKVLNPENNTYDSWYTSFVERGKDLELDVELDRYNQDVWTVFVDKRMEDERGELLGVCTVGVRVTAIQQEIQALEDKYGVNVYFTNLLGEVQLSSGRTMDAGFRLDVSGKDNFGTEFSYETPDGYVSCRLSPLLNWYLVVQNNERLFTHAIGRILYLALGIMILLIVGNLMLNLLSSSNSEYHLNTKADTNALTGLLNRPAIAARVRQYMTQKEAQVSGGTVFLVDIDHLKDVSDNFGQAKADEVQVQIAKALTHAFRSDDIVGEISSYEYVVFCLGALNEETIIRKCELIKRSGTFDVTENGQTVHVTMSVGVSLYPRHGEDFYQLCHSAAEPLRRVRSAGGNGYDIYRGEEENDPVEEAAEAADGANVE